jgi:UDP-N-acetylmuramyl pentapeptide phosphotransferase/UDP-N-acetylglucosamine-1-phosphate transferase
MSHRELAMRVEQTERLALAAAEQAGAAQRTPSPLQSFAISIGATACAIVLAGVVLMVIADVVNLIDPIDLWPLVSLGIAIVAIAVVSLVAGRDRGLDDVVRTIAAPWESERRLNTLEEKVDLLLERVPEKRLGE